MIMPLLLLMLQLLPTDISNNDYNAYGTDDEHNISDK